MNDSQVAEAQKTEHMDKLTADLKKEISVAKSHLARIEAGAEAKPAPSKTPAAKVASGTPSGDKATSTEDDASFSLAEAGQAEQGVSVSDPAAVLSQAEEMLEKKDYQATLRKLEEANEMVSNLKPEGGDVKGASEEAGALAPASGTPEKE
jgi:hypothetical protein